MIACQAQRKAGSATHFIDRNPDRFSKVLDYLRDGKLLADKDCNLEKLRLEADFYGLDDLVRIVDETKAQDELRNRTKHVVVTSKDNNSYSGRWIEIAVNPREDDHFLLRHLQQRYPCRVRAPSFQFPYDFTFELRACSTCATCASGPYDYHCQRNPGYRQHGCTCAPNTVDTMLKESSQPWSPEDTSWTTAMSTLPSLPRAVPVVALSGHCPPPGHSSSENAEATGARS